MPQDSTPKDNFYDEYAATVDERFQAKVAEPSQVKETDVYSVFKRTADILMSLLILPFALIFIVVFAVLIKLESSGPVLYSQERVGYKGKYFNLYKLRSMRQDAEKNGAVWAGSNDIRITKVGKFIRKTRIDELPQLFNILKGDMSIIGPRPERPMFTAEFEQSIPGFTQRLKVKPGLTGWAQVHGGYDITPEAKLKHDLYYIENKGLITDLKIIFKTVKVVFTGNGAR